MNKKYVMSLNRFEHEIIHAHLWWNNNGIFKKKGHNYLIQVLCSNFPWSIQQKSIKHKSRKFILDGIMVLYFKRKDYFLTISWNIFKWNNYGVWALLHHNMSRRQTKLSVYTDKIRFVNHDNYWDWWWVRQICYTIISTPINVYKFP